MNHSHTDPSYRAITIIALIQAGVIVGGTLFVTAMMKARGYEDSIVPDSFFRPIAIFVRHWGFAFLLLPVTWTALAVFAARVSVQAFPLIAMLLLGIAAIVLGIFYYCSLGFNTTIV